MNKKQAGAHTQGEWLISSPDKSLIGIYSNKRKNNGIKAICVIHAQPNNSVTDEDHANAKLIAAAPTLLEVCRYILTCDGVTNGGLIEAAKLAIEEATK